MSKRIIGFLISLITIFNITASMSVCAAGQAAISIEGTATASPGEEVVISVLADIAAGTEIQGMQLIFDYSDNFPTESAGYTLLEKPESWSNSLINSYSLTGIGSVLPDGGKIRGQIKFKVPANAQNGEVYKVSFAECDIALGSSLLAEEEYTIVNNSVEISVEVPEETFDESVVTDMSIVTSSGDVVESPEELKAGEYKLNLTISNLTEDAKNVEMYAAVKIDDKLYSAKSDTAEFNGSDIQSYSTGFPVALPEEANEGNVSIEVYCWDSNMAPFSKKLVFGDVEVYTAYGRITATDRTSSSLYPGYVTFTVEQSDDSTLVSNDILARYTSDNVYNELLRYAKAIIVKNVKAGTYKIVSLKLEDMESTYETSADLYVPDSFATNKISFYTESDGDIGMNTYMLSSAVELYVNGVSIGAVSQNVVDTYIADNDLSEVTLRDINGDDHIDYIFVDYYVDAVIGSVTDGDGTYTINFAEMYLEVQGLTVEKQNSQVKYILDGVEISYTDLLPGDVVSVAYDVTGDFANSAFYNMLVSKDTVTGMVTEIWPDDFGREYFVINGQNYIMSKVSSCVSDTLTPGNAYVIALDVFGRIASYYADPSSRNIGIFDMAYIDSSNSPKIRIITADGEKITYTVKDKSKTSYQEIASQFYEDETIGNNLKPIEMLICEYTLNSDGYITNAWPVTDIAKISDAEYNQASKSFGDCPVDDNASIIDVSSVSNSLDWEYYEINVIQKKSFEELINYMPYDVILAGKPNSYGKYRFVVMLTSGKAFVGSTPVVVNDVEGTVYDDVQGVSVTTYSVYIDGELVRLKLSPGYYKSLKKGDVFLYEMDSNGYVDNITVLFSFGNLNTYSAFMSGMTSETMGYKTVTSSDGAYTKSIPVLSEMPEEWITTDETTKTGNVDLIYGVITDKSNETVSLAQIESKTLESGTTQDVVNPYIADDYDFASDVNVYVCDFSTVLVSKRLKTGSIEDIEKTFVQQADFDQASDGEEVYTVESEDGYREMNFLFGKVVDGKITECVVILGSN